MSDSHVWVAVLLLAGAAIYAVATTMAGGWTRRRAKGAGAPTKQIPTAPWEEETYMRLKTHAARSMWLIYRVTGNDTLHMFYAWVADHLKWRDGCEDIRAQAWREHTSGDLLGGNVDNYLFDSSDANWWTHDDISDGDVCCFVLEFWKREGDGSKKWLRICITVDEGLTYIQHGVSDGRSDTMTATDKPTIVYSHFLKEAMEGFGSPEDT